MAINTIFNFALTFCLRRIPSYAIIFVSSEIPVSVHDIKYLRHIRVPETIDEAALRDAGHVVLVTRLAFARGTRGWEATPHASEPIGTGVVLAPPV